MPIADRQRRRLMRWVVAAAVAVVGVGVAVGGVLLMDEPDLDELMDRRAVAALERAEPNAAPQTHHGHGRPPANPNRRTDIDGNELVCVAKVFGHDPPGATSIDDVTVIYAHRMCAATGPGLTWPNSIRETGPVAIRLGAPDELVMPERAEPEDAPYADRIRAVIPTRYQEQALTHANFMDPAIAEELQDRVDD